MNNENESIGREEFIGEPALFRAARLGDAEAIQALVRGGQDVNQVFAVKRAGGGPDIQVTPLMAAAGSVDGASAETVRLFLELGADAKQIVGGRSAAVCACRGMMAYWTPGGDAERLKVLLKAGSPLPEGTEERNQLLCQTAEFGDPARLKILLENGFGPDGIMRAAKGWERGEQVLGKEFEILEGVTASIDKLVTKGMTGSVREEMEKVMRDSLERSQSGLRSDQIPLFCAATSGNAECVRLLIEAGANVQVRDSSQETAIFHARSLDAIKLLLKTGLDIEDTNHVGWSPLVAAVGDGVEGIEKVKALIAAGANVNGTHDRGYTVFMKAASCMERSVEVMRVLVEAGADPHAVTEIGFNAFHAAVDCDATESKVRAILGYLKELGVDIEHRNNGDRTPLARAILSGDAIDVQVLCELGANPHAICPIYSWREDDDIESVQPLLFQAVRGGGACEEEKTQILLEFGANPMMVDERGMLPLMYAAQVLGNCAVDKAGAYQELMNAVRSLGDVGDSMPQDRKEFVAQMLPLLREKIVKLVAEYPKAGADSIEGILESGLEEFALDQAAILSKISGNAEQVERKPRKTMREEWIDTFVILGVYTLWASREMFDRAKRVW